MWFEQLIGVSEQLSEVYQQLSVQEDRLVSYGMARPNIQQLIAQFQAEK